MQSKNELRTAPEDIITSVTAENGNGGSVVRVQGMFVLLLRNNK